MLEQYYIIGSNQDGPMKYLNFYAIELLENHGAASVFNSIEEIPEHLQKEPYMVLRVTIEKATK